MSAVGTVWTPSILDPREREERRHRRCKQMKDVCGDKESSTKQKTRVASLPSPLNLTGNQWSRNNRRVAWFYICTFFMAAVLSEKKKSPVDPGATAHRLPHDNLLHTRFTTYFQRGETNTSPSSPLMMAVSVIFFPLQLATIRKTKKIDIHPNLKDCSWPFFFFLRTMRL